MNNQEVIFDKLKDNEVVKEILLNQDHVGNLFDMEEALVLATAFKQDHKSLLIVKRIAMKRSNCSKDYPCWRKMCCFLSWKKV